ncbi:terminase [Sphingomonas sp. ABOLF]|uniref:terminase n=1 Tax=Sphingomonas sp. ABOLF TaxID=1985879 RepID=UPI000F7EC73A|nr:terminase [Sphingomonas sp. ABOLF]RSV18105.1 terminase [Sphingomonas sp. ABOLF]
MEIDLEEPTRPQLAAVFGVSSRWIGELRSKGDLPEDGASLLENIEAWAQAKYGIDGAQDALDLDAESARLKKEQADSKAMDNAERRGELASLPDMSGAVISVIAMAVSRLSQVGMIVAKGDHKLRARIEKAVNDALKELSVAKVEKARGGGLDAEEAAEAD